jgi:hypothetical protein
MLAGLPPALPPAAIATGAPALISRRARLLAAVMDGLALLPPLVLTGAVAVAWLLARTAWGRDDATDFDSSLALAILAAGPAAWLARLGYALVTTQATPGQRALGLQVEVTAGRAFPGHQTARALRLAAHPFGAGGWLLVALTVLLTGAWEIATVIAAVGGLLLIAGIVSLAVVLVAPDARGLHDRMAGTRLVRS